jgi:predicted transcriptional regulator of viral defense system
MSRSLSALESQLIMHLEWEKQPVVTIEQAMTILDCSYDHARQVLHRLARRRWLAPITAGTYELIPAERGEHAFSDPNPLFIGSTLIEPYYFSFATAASTASPLRPQPPCVGYLSHPYGFDGGIGLSHL